MRRDLASVAPLDFSKKQEILNIKTSKRREKKDV
nr:MAG TPA_asm: hypothetical protein [Caudoviricetes sp.]